MSKKLPLPNHPFLTADYSPRGGGIDFLGLRWVNLELLSRHLLPGINNATQDMGTYCIGAWIPWKFETLCKSDPKRFRLDEFTAFREAVEVAIACVLRTGSPAEKKWGVARLRIGVEQKISLSGVLNFERAKRTSATSIYAAPLYGPSLRYCGIITDEVLGEDGKILPIPVASQDVDTKVIIEEMDLSLRASKYYAWLNSTRPKRTSLNAIDDLGIHGLHPARVKAASEKLKRAFSKKLLPTSDNESGFKRTLSARLILETVQKRPKIDSWMMRNIWYTGLLDTGKPLNLMLPKSEAQRQSWAIFMARQYQRWAIESIQRLFELELLKGGQSLDGIVGEWLSDWKVRGAIPKTFADILRQEARSAGIKSGGHDWIKASTAWAKEIHLGHDSFDDLEPGEDKDDEIEICYRRLARWWIRMAVHCSNPELSERLKYGGSERISIHWFWTWLDRKKDVSLDKFISEFLSRMIFSQHIRVALGRFDGRVQRVRFLLGDEGITAAASAKKVLGEGLPGWTADRLDAFVSLLCDLEIVSRDDNGRLTAGKKTDLLARN